MRRDPRFRAERRLDHVLRAIEEGWPVDARQWRFAPDLLAAMEKIVGPDEPQKFGRFWLNCPRARRYGQVGLFLRCRAGEGRGFRGGE